MKEKFRLTGTGNIKEKIYVLVKNYRLLNEDVEIYRTEEEAVKAYEKYTGADFSKKYTDPESEFFLEDFSETKIFVIDLPDFLEIKPDMYERE